MFENILYESLKPKVQFTMFIGPSGLNYKSFSDGKFQLHQHLWTKAVNRVKVLFFSQSITL